MYDRVCPECGKVFSSICKQQVCCSDECKFRRKKRQTREAQKYRDHTFEHARSKNKKRQAAERQICRARRDLEWNAMHTPVTVIMQGGIRIERRGTVPAGGRAVSVIRHNA